MDLDEEAKVALLHIPEEEDDVLHRRPPITKRNLITFHHKSSWTYYCTPPACLGLFTLLILYGVLFYSPSSTVVEQPYLDVDPSWDRPHSQPYPACFRANNSSSVPALPAHVSANVKVVLFWTKFFGTENPYLRDKLGACRERKCYLTEDRRFLSRAAAVIFHVRDLSRHDLPACRDARQFYVFFLVESPPHTGLNLRDPPWPGYFDLTLTYRLDSDAFATLYWDQWRPALWTDRSEAGAFLRKKRDKALMFSSNCATPGRREDYVAELGRHFPVDVVGACGRKGCPKQLGKECDDTPDYKFYLAFENSNCKDYMTEKVIRPMNLGTVPVVFGGGAYRQLLPPHSFIHTANFASPKVLADFLWLLARNDTLYAELYEWRYDARYTSVPPAANPADVSMCKLCQILHNDSFPRQRYDDMHAWWDTKADCKSGP